MSKKNPFVPKCLPTGIGSLPFTESKEACETVLQAFPEIPFWPQLPQKSAKENMYWQYSQNLPGLVFEKERMYIKTPDLSEVEKFYEQFLSEDLNLFAITQSFAEGFYQFQNYEKQLKGAFAVKGQITGPVSFLLQVTDENKRSILYNDELKDIAIKNLLRKANWQESILQKFNPNIIMFLDEPYLSAFGSAFTSLSREQVIDSLEEVLQGIKAYTGVHCCGNTDWSLLLETSLDILNLDAYSYADNLLLYEDQLKKYLDRGGSIAWGIVPTDAELLKDVTEKHLLEKLESIWKRLKERKIDQERLLFSSLITPACGLGTVIPEMAQKALTLTKNLSYEIREKYRLM